MRFCFLVTPSILPFARYVTNFLPGVELLEHIPKPQLLPLRCKFVPSPAVLSPLVEVTSHHHSAPIVLQFPYHNLQVMQQHCERTFAACKGSVAGFGDDLSAEERAYQQAQRQHSS